MKFLSKIKSQIKPKKENRKVKFSAGDFNKSDIEFDYGNIYQQTDNSIKISANNNQVKLLTKLLESLKPPYYVLYVLVTSRTEKEIGRYQSPLFENKDDLISFLRLYEDYFETDGRHHIWIGTTDNSGLIVYDQHNVVFGYGPLALFEKTIIEEFNYKQKEFEFPAPHCHSFHPENDIYEESLINYFDWDIFPLQAQDTYDD